MKMKSIVTLFSFSFTLLTSAISMNAEVSAADKAKAIFSQKSKAEINKYYNDFHQRIPNKHNTGQLKGNILEQIQIPANSKTEIKSFVELPEVPHDLTIPGEFEELKAVVVTWPYINIDDLGEPVEMLLEGIGMKYNEITEDYTIVPAISFPDLEVQSPFPPLFLDMIFGIQSEAEVWLAVVSLEDSIAIKKYAMDNNKPLTNVKFFRAPNNSFWYRDCGPVAFYYDNYAKVGFIDFEYYPGRALDDQLSEWISAATNYPILKSTIEYEGGNILVDGKDILFTSDALTYGNADYDGQLFLNKQTGDIDYSHKDSLGLKECKDSLIAVMNLKAIHVLPTLINDGGTGHIDLYADMFDENQFVFSTFPSEMSKHSDYKIAGKNIDTLVSIISQNGKNYTQNNIPFPRKDNGSWYKSEKEYAKYTRTYTNHLVVNKAIIQPVFSNGVSGDNSGDLASLEVIKKAYPGYKIIPVDMRAFDGFGGSIHCITKQIPADNPIRIFHRTLTNEDMKSDGTNAYFEVQANIESNKEISDATVYYREVGTTEWKTSVMTKSEAIYSAQMSASLLNNSTNEYASIEYYISASAQSINKTITKPMTAPEGFYTISNSTSAVSENIIKELQVYPNPASNQVFLNFNIENSGAYCLQIVNETGAIVYKNDISNSGVGDQVLSINTELFPVGTYFLTIIDAKMSSRTTKFIVNR